MNHKRKIEFVSEELPLEFANGDDEGFPEFSANFETIDSIGTPDFEDFEPHPPVELVHEGDPSGMGMKTTARYNREFHPYMPSEMTFHTPPDPDLELESIGNLIEDEQQRMRAEVTAAMTEVGEDRVDSEVTKIETPGGQQVSTVSTIPSRTLDTSLRRVASGHGIICNRSVKFITLFPPRGDGDPHEQFDTRLPKPEGLLTLIRTPLRGCISAVDVEANRPSHAPRLTYGIHDGWVGFYTEAPDNMEDDLYAHLVHALDSLYPLANALYELERGIGISEIPADGHGKSGLWLSDPRLYDELEQWREDRPDPNPPDSYRIDSPVTHDNVVALAKPVYELFLPELEDSILRKNASETEIRRWRDAPDHPAIPQKVHPQQGIRQGSTFPG